MSDKLSNANYINKENKNINNFFKDEAKNIIYYPSSSKEWFSNIYSYNKSYIKSLIVCDVILNKLFRSYYNMLQYNIKVLFKRRRHNKSRYSANKIFISRTELKHTNTKLFIVLYTYNKQKSSIERYIRKLITLTKINKTFVENDTKYIITYKSRLVCLLKNKFFLFKK